jgi:N-acetylmuramoyl-L-alanine amidase
MPIKYIIFIVLSLCAPAWAKKSPMVIMLDPAGDAQYTGRTIDGTFERGITLQCAKALKELVQRENPSIQIIISRSPGEGYEPLRNAHYANCRHVSLFISLACYQETQPVPELYLYYFDAGYSFVPLVQECSLLSVDQAYVLNKIKTEQWASVMYNLIAQPEYQRLVKVHEPLGIRAKPLLGIQAPALIIEMGLKKKNDWRFMLQPLAQALQVIAYHYENNHE